jgi:hypothetical protein
MVALGSDWHLVTVEIQGVDVPAFPVSLGSVLPGLTAGAAGRKRAMSRRRWAAGGSRAP